MAKRSRLRRIGVPILGVFCSLVICLVGACVLLSKPLPSGESGPAADALARSIELAVHKADWDRTAAVTWLFAGRHRHLWDKQRMYDRVRWGDLEVQVNLTTQTGVALRNGVPLHGAEAQKLVKKAYAYWINDSFWLNPLVKLFDDGVKRSRIAMPDGQAALLITYSSGGLTPGDSYLWRLGPGNLPVVNAMWVSVLPVKGLSFSYEGWTTLSTGARISTLHKASIFSLKLEDVAGAATLTGLSPGADPFAALASGQIR